jgi:hypothetical protein
MGVMEGATRGPARRWEQKQVQIKTMEGEFSVTMWATGDTDGNHLFHFLTLLWVWCTTCGTLIKCTMCDTPMKCTICGTRIQCVICGTQIHCVICGTLVQCVICGTL